MELFDGKDLKSFDTFLTKEGLNSDPDDVFKVENGVVHISGTEMGYIITKREYSNYHLVEICPITNFPALRFPGECNLFSIRREGGSPCSTGKIRDRYNTKVRCAA